MRMVHTALGIAYLGPLVEAVEQHDAAVALEQAVEHACEKATAVTQQSFLTFWTLHTQAGILTQLVRAFVNLAVLAARLSPPQTRFAR